MILDLFVPEILNNSFIIKRKVLSVYFTSKYIFASIVLLSGKNRQVVFSKKNIIQEDSSEALETLWAKELQKMIQNLDYDFVYFIIPSSSVLFKFQTFNLEDIDQIKMILPIELENVLPIAIDEIALDTMSLGYDKTTNEHKIISVICKKDTLSIYLDIAKNCQIKLTKVMVDILPVYSFITKYLNLKTSFFSILSQDNVTSCLFENYNILAIKNSFDIIKKINASEKKPSEETNLEVPVEKKNEDFIELLKDFTNKLIPEYTDTTKFAETPHIILINHDKYKEIKEEIEKKLPNTKVIDNSSLLSLNITFIKEDLNSSQDIILCIVSGLYYESLEDFNLLKEEEKELFVSKLARQIYVFSGLFLIILSIFFTINIINIKKYNHRIHDIEKDIIIFLKNSFSITYRSEYPLDKVYKDSEQSVSDAELIWSNLSAYNKYLHIKLLEKLSAILGNDLQDLIIEEIQFKKDNKKNMQIQLKVKTTSYDILKKLEERLKTSKLFMPFVQAQDLEFIYNLTFISKDIQ